MKRPLDNFADIHSHRAPVPEDAGRRIFSLDPRKGAMLPGYSYSVGFHPWYGIPTDNEWASLAELAHNEAVVAIGEAGLDKLRGAPVDDQIPVFERQARLAEEVGKPLVIHCVRAYDVLLAMHKRLQPRQLWIVHGFRGNNALARQLTDKGIAISLVTDAQVPDVPQELVYRETD